MGKEGKSVFFRDFYNPYLSVTCLVDCKGLKQWAKEHDKSFFLCYLFAIVKALNEIKELRYRYDASGAIVLYDWVDILSPVKVKGMSTFCTVRMSYDEDFETFHYSAKEVIRHAGKVSTFEVEQACVDNDVVLVSAVPDLPFVSFTGTSHSKHEDYPLITVGAVSKDEKLPVALRAHHAFVDGEHISQFYKNISRIINRHIVMAHIGHPCRLYELSQRIGETA